MKSKYFGLGILVLAVIGSIFLIGCVQSSKQETVTCNPPYLKVGTSCCLDQNSNNICDKDETQIQEERQKPQTYCGDGTCQSNEGCSTCSKDCGKCESVVITPSKKYGPNQIECCEEEYISIGGTKDRDLCYRYYAVQETNYLYCEQISDISKRDDCYYTVGRMDQNTYVCGLISTSSNCEGTAQGESGMLDCKDSCYHDIAVGTLNPSICQDIRTQNGKDACYWRVALNSKNSNLCSKIVTSSGTISNDFCYYSIAVQNNNINICSPINDAKQHDQCMMVVIRNLKLKDLSLCNQMTTDWKISCQHEIETGKYLS